MTAQTQSNGNSRNASRAATLWVVAWVSAAMLLLLGLAMAQRGTPAVAAAAGPARQAYHTKNIEDVRAGEKVWAYDVAAGRWEPREVVRPLTHEYDGDVVTVSAGGQKIEATGNHPFWVARGEDLSSRPQAEDIPTAERGVQADGRWVEARHLQPGDLLLLRSGELATVEELASRREKLKVYNLEVADLHTYAVGTAGVLVHNKAMQIAPVPPRGAAPGVRPNASVNGVVGDLHGQGYVYQGPTRSGNGRLYRNPNTGQEVRVMPRPPRAFRNDPPAKHQNSNYYRYRSGPDQPWREHQPIPDPPRPRR